MQGKCLTCTTHYVSVRKAPYSGKRRKRFFSKAFSTSHDWCVHGLRVLCITRMHSAARIVCWMMCNRILCELRLLPFTLARLLPYQDEFTIKIRYKGLFSAAVSLSLRMHDDIAADWVLACAHIHTYLLPYLHTYTWSPMEMAVLA